MFRRPNLLAASALLASACVLAACATDAPVSAPRTAPPAVVPAAPAASSPAASRAASPAPAVTASAAQAADGDATICRRVDVLGSRVRKERICKTKDEWDLIEQQKRETFRAIDRGSSGAGADPALGGG